MFRPLLRRLLRRPPTRHARALSSLNLGQLPAWKRVPEGHIDFSVGQPGRDLLPLRTLAAACERQLGGGAGDDAWDERTFLQYGPSQGDAQFRARLASFLGRELCSTVDPDSLLVTNGSSQGLELLASVFTKPGDTVLVDKPTYFLVGKVFADHGLRVIGVDTDDDGLVVDDALEAAMVAHRPAMLYTVPIHGNPTASTMPPHRIEALVRLARKHAVVVASDEVYQLLGFNGYGSDGGGNGNGGDTIREDGEDGKGCSEEGDDVKDSRDSSSRPWRSLATYDDSDDGGNVVVALNSFSKILCPGLRLGWLQAHPSLIEAILERGFMVSGGGLNPFTAAIVEATLEPLAGDTTDAEGGGSVDGDGSSGQGAHLAVVRRALKARSEALLSALHEYLPDVEIAARPEGGYFVWLTLPGGGEEGEGNGEGDGGEGRTNAVVTAVQLLEVAQRGGHRVGFLPGPKFDISEGNGAGPGSLDHCFRLCFAYYNEAELTEGVKRLAAALAQAREEVGGEHY